MKLSNIQIFWLMFTIQAGNTILITINPAIEKAKQDAWISFLIASLLAILIVFVATKTAQLYPNHSLIQFSKLILGKWLGTIVVIFYLLQWYSIMPILLMQFADFINTAVLPNTPQWILILSMMLLIIYITRIGGIEGIGRCSEVFGPMIATSVFILVILTLKDFHINHLLPVLADSGPLSIWQGALHPLSFFAESVIILMFVSFTGKSTGVLKSAIWGMALATFSVFIVVISVLLTFGPEISAKMVHPAFDMISYISIMDFIQNLEILAVLVWALSIFIKVSVYFFLVCYGSSQLLNIKNWKKMIWITAPFFLFSTMLIPNLAYPLMYSNTIWIGFLYVSSFSRLFRNANIYSTLLLYT